MKAPHIVLIEDNPGDVMLVRLALKENDIQHTLTHFSSGADAVRVLCDTSSGTASVPDVILLDLNTPQMDGFEAVQRFRDSPQLSQIPLAILTSSRASVDKRRAEELGADFIEKPTQLQDFLSSVGNAVKGMLERVTTSLPGR